MWGEMVTRERTVAYRLCRRKNLKHSRARYRQHLLPALCVCVRGGHSKHSVSGREGEMRISSSLDPKVPTLEKDLKQISNIMPVLGCLGWAGAALPEGTLGNALAAGTKGSGAALARWALGQWLAWPISDATSASTFHILGKNRLLEGDT